MRTVVLYAIIRVTTAVTAAFSAPVASTVVGVALAGLFAAGALRGWAIGELGDRYSHRVAQITDGGLVCSGPYRRHPAYAGMLIANIGFVAYFANPASIAALVLLFAAIAWQIRVEEDVLLRSPTYREFAGTRSRIIPGPWR